jgi:phosphoribosylformylglycinamidine synthase
LPIAHGAGRYHADRATLAALEAENRIAFRYAHADGRSDAAANPNGSALEIAGIYGGPARNVLGMMPHPERRSEPLHGGLDGKSLFDAMLYAHPATAPEDRAAFFSDPELR